MSLGTGLGEDLGVFFIKIPKVTSARSSLLNMLNLYRGGREQSREAGEEDGGL